MHILYDHQIFQAQQYGGISRYFAELVSRAASTPTIDVSVFLGFYVNQYGVERYRGYFRYFYGFERPMIPKTGKIFSALNAQIFTQKMHSWKPELYHQTYFSEVAEDFSGKRIVTVYDMIHELYPHFYPGDDKTRENKAAAVERADLVIAISNSTKNDLIKIYGTPESKIKVIHLANSLHRKVNEPRSVADPYVLFVGARQGYKNFLLYLNAFSQIKNIPKNLKLVCFGGGPFNLEEQSAIARSGLGDRIIHLGGGDEILSRLYRYADFFVYPSHYEGFGIPVLEAMHYGCPVVVCNSSSLPEVGGNAAIYFKQSDSKDLAEKMSGLIQDQKWRKEISDAGKAHEAKFDWDITFKETLLTYQSLF